MGAATCCELDHTKPNVSDMSPPNGYAINGYQTKKTESCPPGYHCLDYKFPTTGQNWWNMEATDVCGLRRITGNANFCVGACPRYLRESKETISESIADGN